MKSLFNKYIWLQFILSILLIFAGTLIVVFAATEKQNILEDGLNIIAAVILFLFGAFAILASFAFETEKLMTNGLLYGSACIALGVFLCMKEFVLLNYLVYLLAIFFIVIGGTEIIKAIILIVKKSPKLLGIILTFIIATLFVAGGILALIYREHVSLAFCIIVGLLVFAVGAYLLVLGIISIIGQIKVKGKEPASNQVDNQKEESNEPEKVEQIEEEKEIKEIDYTEEKPEEENN